ncbi:MAG: Hsp20/alpha crystallin family protein [Syntrophorhabdaceae bacterium]|nr:Hsp20/alpha crystallin family protein [Syntrophorhabdales bacterium]MBP9561118.1 Hsp20/alpha crystallin family protein [Syntrophorhabdaceae bacterium]
MAELALWQPLKEMERIRKEMDNIWDTFFDRTPGKGYGVSEWLPSLDVSETKNNYIVNAEIPGIDPKEVEISLNDNILTIKGEKKQEKEEENENYHVIERSYGGFTRSLRLPGQIQGDKVKATYKNGILKITLPKTEEAKKKEIKVAVE